MSYSLSPIALPDISSKVHLFAHYVLVSYTVLEPAISLFEAQVP